MMRYFTTAVLALQASLWGCSGVFPGSEDDAASVEGEPSASADDNQEGDPTSSASEGAGGAAGEDPGLDPKTSPAPLTPADLQATSVAAEPIVTGLRRLNRAEYASAVRALISAAAPVDVGRLPIDETLPFDNYYRTQAPSNALVEGVDAVASEVADWVLGQSELAATLLGCQPSGPDDAACLRSFGESFGARALRRDLTSAELDELETLVSFAEEESSFDVALGMALRVFLTHPEFLYRVERQEQLSDFEIATRLAFTLTGSIPDALALEAARAGDLHTAEQVMAEAERLLALSAAADHLGRFHALWLGYERFVFDTTIQNQMRDAAGRLVADIVLTRQAPYSDLLRSEQTWLTAELADNYGLPAIDEPGFSAWPSADRRGILAEGAFLAAGSKASDSSPTRRGKFVRTQLLCQTIAPPPGLVIDMEPQAADPNACKKERYVEHRAEAVCASCHALLDPIGFGLEQYDLLGRFRTSDDGRPECPLDGAGELVGEGGGAFSGPAELGELILGTGLFETCAAIRSYEFAVGRPAQTSDAGLVKLMADGLKEHQDFRQMLLTLVSHAMFSQKSDEVLQ